MTGAELLAELRSRGCRVNAAGGKLLVCPGSRLSSTDRAAIQFRVSELLDELAGEQDGGSARAAADALAAELLRRLRARAKGAPA